MGPNFHLSCACLKSQKRLVPVGFIVPMSSKRTLSLGQQVQSSLLLLFASIFLTCFLHLRENPKLRVCLESRRRQGD